MSSGLGSASVSRVMLTPMSLAVSPGSIAERGDLVGDLADLLVAQPAAQQRHERDVVLRGHARGVALEQPVHDATKARVQSHGFRPHLLTMVG